MDMFEVHNSYFFPTFPREGTESKIENTAFLMVFRK